MRNAIKISTTIFAIIVLAALGVYGQKVTFDSAPGTDFTKYKTYKWQRAPGALYPEAVIDEIILRNIEEQLREVGLVRTAGDSADAYVVYQFAIANDAKLNTFTNDVYWQGGDNTWDHLHSATTNASTLIERGWLMIHMYDARSKKLFFQASVRKTLSKGRNPAKIEKNAHKAVAKIFDKYPSS